MHDSSMSSNFGLIGPPTGDLDALKRQKNPHRLIMGKRMSPYNNIQESLDEFEIQPDSTTGFHGNR